MTDDTPPTKDYTSPEYYAWYDAHMQAQVNALVHEALNALGTPHSDAQTWQLSAYVAVLLAQDAVSRPDEPLQVPSAYQDASAQRVMDYLYAQVSALRNRDAPAMTDDEILAQIGDKPAGGITTHSAEEVNRITAILRERGYRWRLAYTIDGQTCMVMFYVDPKAPAIEQGS